MDFVAPSHIRIARERVDTALAEARTRRLLRRARELAGAPARHGPAGAGHRPVLARLAARLGAALTERLPRRAPTPCPTC